MSFHLFLGPVDNLSEAVEILEHCEVSDRRSLLSDRLVLDQFDLDVLVERIILQQFSVLNSHRIELAVLTGADGELNVAFIAKLKLCHLASELSVIERHEIILSELRRWRELKRLS